MWGQARGGDGRLEGRLEGRLARLAFLTTYESPSGIWTPRPRRGVPADAAVAPPSVAPAPAAAPPPGRTAARLFKTFCRNAALLVTAVSRRGSKMASAGRPATVWESERQVIR